MSKSLKAKIENEIRRREKEQLEKNQKEDKKRNDVEKERIIEFFENALEECLKKMEPYKEHKVLTDYFSHISIAEELGFNVVLKRKERYSEFDYYYFKVPNFEKNTKNKRSVAQLKLYRFEKKLKKAQRERKKELLEECKRIKQEISEGHFQDIKCSKKINITSKIEVNNNFDRNIVYEYFSRFNLYFSTLEGSEWSFLL